MGIPKLNKWLLDNCSSTSIQKKHLTEFQDKRVAIDISIYLYRFLMDGRFIEHLYLFLSTMRYYCIRPVIVFDGKAPIEKQATIQRRHKDKQEANQQYKAIEERLAHLPANDPSRSSLLLQLASLKKRMVRLTWSHIDSAIELIQAFGFEYYLAPHEADQLCIYLAHTHNVDIILSDDMDLVISGAPIIWRGLNIVSHEIFLYDIPAILCDLDMPIEDFRATVVLSGTDYEMKTPFLSMKRCFELYRQYKEKEEGFTSFTDWLGHKGIIEPVEFRNICSLFDTEKDAVELAEFVEKNKPTVKPRLNLTAIQTIMRKHKFIFVS